MTSSPETDDMTIPGDGPHNMDEQPQAFSRKTIPVTELDDHELQLIRNAVVETDAPYLSPVPHRGKRNEPAFIAHTVEFIAKSLGMTSDDTAALTTANARRLFKLD